MTRKAILVREQMKESMETYGPHQLNFAVSWKMRMGALGGMMPDVYTHGRFALKNGISQQYFEDSGYICYVCCPNPELTNYSFSHKDREHINKLGRIVTGIMFCKLGVEDQLMFKGYLSIEDMNRAKLWGNMKKGKYYSGFEYYSIPAKVAEKCPRLPHEISQYCLHRVFHGPEPFRVIKDRRS